MQVRRLNGLRRSLTEQVYARSAAEPDPTLNGSLFREPFTRNTAVSLSLLRFHRQLHDTPAVFLGTMLDEFGVTEANLMEKMGPMPGPPTPEQVSAALPERAVLLDLLRYAVGDGQPQYVAFVVRHRSGPVRIELGAAAPIDRAARRWREAMERRADGMERALDLARRLWAPLARPAKGSRSCCFRPTAN